MISTIQMNMAYFFFSCSCDQLFLITSSQCGQGAQALLAQSDPMQYKLFFFSLLLLPELPLNIHTLDS